MMHRNFEGGEFDELSQALNALANPHRLSIVSHLQRGEMTVGALANALGLGQSALSQHLHKLRVVALVKIRKQQQLRYYRLDRDNLALLLSKLSGWMS